MGAIINLGEIDGTYLYTIRAVDPQVMSALNLMEENSNEYKAMEEGRTSTCRSPSPSFISAFALIVLLAAIWAAIAVADRIVRPIRLLINAADNVVGAGNLNVIVPVRAADGDVGSLSRTFNQDDLRDPHAARRDPRCQGRSG